MPFDTVDEDQIGFNADFSTTPTTVAIPKTGLYRATFHISSSYYQNLLVTALLKNGAGFAAGAGSQNYFYEGNWRTGTFSANAGDLLSIQIECGNTGTIDYAFLEIEQVA